MELWDIKESHLRGISSKLRPEKGWTFKISSIMPSPWISLNRKLLSRWAWQPWCPSSLKGLHQACHSLNMAVLESSNIKLRTSKIFCHPRKPSFTRLGSLPVSAGVLHYHCFSYIKLIAKSVRQSFPILRTIFFAASLVQGSRAEYFSFCLQDFQDEAATLYPIFLWDHVWRRNLSHCISWWGIL